MSPPYLFAISAPSNPPSACSTQFGGSIGLCTPAVLKTFIGTDNKKSDGSYYYSNPNGSTYHNNGQGGSTYTAPSGSKYQSGYGRKS